MDASNKSLHVAHLQQHDSNNAYPDFLSGVHSFGAAADNSASNDDIQDYFHPELFDTQDAASTAPPQQPQQQQPSQNYQSAFNQHAARQSQSPALPAYNPNQSNFNQHPPYNQPVFDPRTMYQGQQSFDPRFYQQRPSQSPVPLDQYNFQNSNFNSQGYHQQPMSFQQRQSATPTPNFPHSQQAYTPFTNFESRNSTRVQQQSAQMTQFNAFQDPNQKPSQTFVDPSMLNANQSNFANGHYPQMTQRSIQPSPYFSQSASTIDPRSLHGQPVLQPAPLNVPQPPTGQPHPGLLGQTRPDSQVQKKALKDPNTSKKAKGQPRKDGLMPGQNSQGTNSGSDSDSDISVEEEPERTPALLSVQMPTDEKGKAMYQAVQAVWSPRNLRAPVEKIKSGLVQFGDTIKGLRDSWKDKNESLKKAELPNSTTAANAPQLKADVAHYRQIVETVVNRSLQHAHPAILKRYVIRPSPQTREKIAERVKWGAFQIPALSVIAHTAPDESAYATQSELSQGSVGRPLVLAFNLPDLGSPASLDSLRICLRRATAGTRDSKSLRIRPPEVCFLTDLYLRLGENQWTMSALYAFMLDRVTVGDHDSLLVTSILKLAVNFNTLDEEKLEATKWPKLLQRLTKKAATESKTLAETVLNNAAAASAKKKAALANGDVAGGVKRGREGESLPQPVMKKALVRPSSKPLALQNAERRRAKEAAEAAKKNEKLSSGTNGVNASAAGQKAKVVVQQPPKVASFASLMSASKKPGTSNAERAAATQDMPKAAASSTPQVKKESVKTDSPPRGVSATAESKSTSSLMGFLSALEKKEEVKPIKIDPVLDETPEQKEKRLRKESRRRLRVSWKSDAGLVETRIFTHDPDEDFGHSDNSMKDAGDTMKEGEMLKRHQGMEDLDEDEDDAEGEPEFIGYVTPTEVDFSVLQDVLSFNGVKYGGTLQVESPSREAQEKLEMNTVMVVYTSQEDRPKSPKEAPEEGDDAEFQPCVDFGPVPSEVRKKEEDVYGRGSMGVPGINRVNLPASQSQTGQMDLQSILGMLKPQSVPAPQATGTTQYDLQKLVASVAKISHQMQESGQAHQQQQPTQPPAATSLPSSNLSSLLASFQQAATSQGTGLPVGIGSNLNPYPGAEKHGLDAADYGQSKAGKKKKGNNPPKPDGSIPANYKTQTCQFWLEGKCNKGDNCTYRHDRLAS